MSEPLPPVVLSVKDVKYLVDELAHIERGVIAGGLTAHRWLTEQHEEDNRERFRWDLPRRHFRGFLDYFINERAPAARSRVNHMGWDPSNLPEGVTFSVADKQILRDVLALDKVEDALWRRSKVGKAQLAESEARARAYVTRHKQRFPEGEFLPPLGWRPGNPLPPQPVSEAVPMPTEPTAWMLRHACIHYGGTGDKLPQKPGTAACIAALECSVRDAGAAYRALPEVLRFTPGQRVRR